MNERIKQLADESGISVTYLINTKQWVCIEAFAEKIVRECGDIAYKTYWDNPLDSRGIHFKEAMYKQFGIQDANKI